jgi:hypothetical protein
MAMASNGGDDELGMRSSRAEGGFGAVGHMAGDGNARTGDSRGSSHPSTK